MVDHGLRTIVDGLDHPEGRVLVSPRHGAVCGRRGRSGVPLSARGRRARTGRDRSQRLSPRNCARRSGRRVRMRHGRRGIARLGPGGELTRHGGDIAYPNYPVFDEDGSLWVSDSGDWEQPTSGLVRIDPDGSSVRVADGFAFANGLAISGGLALSRRVSSARRRAHPSRGRRHGTGRRTRPGRSRRARVRRRGWPLDLLLAAESRLPARPRRRARDRA